MCKELLNIDAIRKKIELGNIFWTKHCLNRLNQRNISIADIKQAVNNGKIVEYYYDDYPYPSCLIAGYKINNTIIHIVCGINENIVHMITAYYPDDTRWEKDMEIRRKE